MLFTSIWAIIKGWLDEKTRKKVNICGSNYLKTLLEIANSDQIPEILGGTCKATFNDDYGPWTEYEIVDSSTPGDVVGIRRTNDPYGKIYTSRDIAALENPVIPGLGVEGTKGAMIIHEDGSMTPNQEANKSSKI